MKRFAPYYQPAIWGGRRLEHLFKRNLPAGQIGESWELCDLPTHHSAVVSGGGEGTRLGDLWRSGALGGSAQGSFPFLLKWIDAEADLSVQVHPDERACVELGNDALPKSEAWYIASLANPDCRLFLGHKPGLTAERLVESAQNNTIKTYLREVRVQVGDMIYVPAGTIHAIGGGIFLLEVQQPSDTTFRVYDWGRVDAEGKSRPLHMSEALKSIDFAAHEVFKPAEQRVMGPSFAMEVLSPGARLTADKLRVLVAHHGAVRLAFGKDLARQAELQWGDVVVGEVQDGLIEVSSGSVMGISES
jgi:mannose-6-phosphate isomerase